MPRPNVLICDEPEDFPTEVEMREYHTHELPHVVVDDPDYGTDVVYGLRRIGVM